MTYQNNYVKQSKAEWKKNYDHMTNQRQDFYDQEAVQCKHLYTLSVRHTQYEDCYSQEQSR